MERSPSKDIVFPLFFYAFKLKSYLTGTIDLTKEGDWQKSQRFINAITGIEKSFDSTHGSILIWNWLKHGTPEQVTYFFYLFFIIILFFFTLTLYLSSLSFLFIFPLYLSSLSLSSPLFSQFISNTSSDRSRQTIWSRNDEHVCSKWWWTITLGYSSD
jgi:hypothetical protein